MLTEIIITATIMVALAGLALGMALRARTRRANARAVALRIHATLDGYERPRGLALPPKCADARTLALTRELTGVNLPRVPHDEAGEL